MEIYADELCTVAVDIAYVEIKTSLQQQKNVILHLCSNKYKGKDNKNVNRLVSISITLQCYIGYHCFILSELYHT